MAVTLLIADECLIMREGFRAALARDPELQVLGEAACADELHERIAAQVPDVVLLELSLPGGDVSELIRSLRSQHAGRCRVIAFTRDGRNHRLVEALRAGAAGCLPVNAAPDDARAAVTAVAAGRLYVAPSLAGEVAGCLVQPLQPNLSKREFEVLRLVAEGCSTREVGRRLGLSAHTIDTHRRNLMSKLQVHKVADLVRYAIRESIVNP